MSNEALFAEVRANLPVSLAVKAADAQFSHDIRTYTHVSTDVSHQGGKKRHDSHKKSVSVSDKKDDKKSSRNKKRNHRSTSGENELASLHSEISELREDNASIRKELDDLRRLVQKSQSLDWVLILGDGQLSFSHAFALKYPEAHITATVLEDSKDFMKRYPTGRHFAEKLERLAPRVRLQFGVDATQLTKQFVRNFRYVFMNFPHPGGKNNTRANRELLSRIFRCLNHVLKSRTEFRLTLRASQIGLNLGDDLERATCSEPPPHQSDSWRTVYLAADNGMFLDSIEKFQDLEGYQTSGYKNQDKFFHNDDALTLTFYKLTVGDSDLTCQKSQAGPSKKEATPAKDDDFDLFGSDEEEEDEESKRVREERLAAYAAKKSKKPGPIAKSSVILDVKPWDDETSLDEMEKHVKSIQMDGLLWGATKKVPIGYGISKLQIVCTVEDEKVSVDELTEKIQEFEDFVQSVDIVAFNKI